MRPSILMASVLLGTLATLASYGAPAATTVHPSPAVTSTTIAHLALLVA